MLQKVFYGKWLEELPPAEHQASSSAPGDAAQQDCGEGGARQPAVQEVAGPSQHTGEQVLAGSKAKQSE